MENNERNCDIQTDAMNYITHDTADNVRSVAKFLTPLLMVADRSLDAVVINKLASSFVEEFEKHSIIESEPNVFAPLNSKLAAGWFLEVLTYTLWNANKKKSFGMAPQDLDMAFKEFQNVGYPHDGNGYSNIIKNKMKSKDKIINFSQYANDEDDEESEGEVLRDRFMRNVKEEKKDSNIIATMQFGDATYYKSLLKGFLTKYDITEDEKDEALETICPLIDRIQEIDEEIVPKLLKDIMCLSFVSMGLMIGCDHEYTRYDNPNSIISYAVCVCLQSCSSVFHKNVDTKTYKDLDSHLPDFVEEIETHGSTSDNDNPIKFTIEAMEKVVEFLKKYVKEDDTAISDDE